MKKLVLIIGFLNLGLTLFSQSVNEEWLSKSFHPVSTDAKNKDYSDLQFLKEDLKDKKIVALGEQKHEDGKTFEARSRLIQFLIQEMGFEAILFEAGIFDVKYGWKSYQELDSLQYFTKSLMIQWREKKQHVELFSFIDTWKKEGNTLEMDGFDCKFTSRHRTKYTHELDSIVYQINPELKSNAEYLAYHDILEEHGNATFIRAALPNLSKKETKQFITGSQLVRETLAQANHPFLQTVISMDDGILLYSELSVFDLIFSKKSLIALNNERDVLMAEALNHLLENEYKDKKVILFGATYHFIRNNEELITIGKTQVPIPESTIMGDLMHKKYHKDIYTIGFAAYSGFYGEGMDTLGGTEIIPAVDGSLEKKLHDLNSGNGLLILSNSQTKPSWWYDDLSIRLFSYESTVASKDWSHVLDAVFYIENMEPSYELGVKKKSSSLNVVAWGIGLVILFGLFIFVRKKLRKRKRIKNGE
jgi:erythromycin esterase